MITKEELIAFEKEIEGRFLNKEIRAPIHLSSGNEDVLIDIFAKYYNKGDWIFSNWRNHYHILLAGADPEWVKSEILAGHSMSMCCKDPKFISSSIVAGLLGQAVGTAWALKQQGAKEKVICFVGDMTSMTGTFYEAQSYAEAFDLPILFVIEDNGLSVGTPTQQTWGYSCPYLEPEDCTKEPIMIRINTLYYQYVNTKWPHVGIPTWVGF